MAPHLIASAQRAPPVTADADALVPVGSLHAHCTLTEPPAWRPRSPKVRVSMFALGLAGLKGCPLQGAVSSKVNNSESGRSASSGTAVICSSATGSSMS
jgi:hypothetical protein